MAEERVAEGSIPPYDPTIAQKGFSRGQCPIIHAADGTKSPLPDPDWDWRFARSRCLREARRVLRDREDAEEAVQEAMTRAWRRRAACESQDDPLGWILRITHNEALRILNGRTRRSEHEVTALVETREAPSEDPIDVVLADIAAQDLLACLRPDERVLIHLRYRHDLSQAEVARRLDLPEGTVKVRLHRIRARLRNAWREDNQT